jgi:hypothetical protein
VLHVRTGLLGNLPGLQQIRQHLSVLPGGLLDALVGLLALENVAFKPASAQRAVQPFHAALVVFKRGFHTGCISSSAAPLGLSKMLLVFLQTQFDVI